MVNTKKFRKVRKLESGFALGALAKNAVVVITTPPIMVQGGFVTKTNVMTHLSALTAGEGVGLILGLADSQLSGTEIEECLEAGGPTFQGQEPQDPRAQRKVRIVGHIGPEGELVPTTTVVSRAYPEFPSMMAFTEDSTGVRWFVYNLGATLTTGALLDLLYSHNIKFLPKS